MLLADLSSVSLSCANVGQRRAWAPWLTSASYRSGECIPGCPARSLWCDRKYADRGGSPKGTEEFDQGCAGILQGLDHETCCVALAPSQLETMLKLQDELTDWGACDADCQHSLSMGWRHNEVFSFAHCIPTTFPACT